MSRSATPRQILFYSVGDEFGEFSNFAPFPINLSGKRWATSEHYFQAQKFLDTSDRERVRLAKTPALAARHGRDRTKKLRRDWDSVKVSSCVKPSRPSSVSIPTFGSYSCRQTTQSSSSTPPTTTSGVTVAMVPDETCSDGS